MEVFEPRSFGEHIRHGRRMSRQTQGDLVFVVNVVLVLKRKNHKGISPSYLSKIETDKLIPSSPVISALADTLSMDSDLLHILAGKLPVELEGKLAKNPAALDFFKWAIERLSAEEWKGLLAEQKVHFPET